MMSETEIEKWKPVANHWISTKTSSIFSTEKIKIPIICGDCCQYCGNEDTQRIKMKLKFCSLFCEEVYLKNFYPHSKETFFVNFDLLTNKSKRELQEHIKNFPKDYDQFFLTNDFSNNTIHKQRVCFQVTINFFKNFVEIGTYNFEITTHIKICFCKPFVSEKRLSFDECAKEAKRTGSPLCRWCLMRKPTCKLCLSCNDDVVNPVVHKDKRIVIDSFCSEFCKEHYLFRNQRYDNVIQNYSIKLPSPSLMSKETLTYLKNKTASKKHTIHCNLVNNTIVIDLKLSRNVKPK